MCAFRAYGTVEHSFDRREARRAHPPALFPAPETLLREEVPWHPAEEVDEQPHSCIVAPDMVYSSEVRYGDEHDSTDKHFEMPHVNVRSAL